MKFQTLRLATLLKRLQQWCFPVNFAVLKNIDFAEYLQKASFELGARYIISFLKSV